MTAEPMPSLVEELMERRRRAGADRFDEMWDGVLHMSPDPSRVHLDVLQQLAEILGQLARAAGLYPGIGGFNLGESEHDYRCPDGGLFRERSTAVRTSTAALVLEIVSPDDDSWNKFDFFASHGVDEVLIVDPQKRSVDWFTLREGGYAQIERSALVELGAAELAQRLDWPDIDA